MQALGCGLSGWSRAVQKIQADRKQLSKRIAAYSAEVAHTICAVHPPAASHQQWLAAQSQVIPSSAAQSNGYCMPSPCMRTQVLSGVYVAIMFTDHLICTLLC